MFSRAVEREGHCRQKSLVCVGSTLGVPATLGLPRSQNVCFPRLHCSGSRLLYRGRALCCVHFPGLSCSGSGCGYSTKMQIGLGLRFVPSLVGVTQAPRSLMSTLSPGAGCLIASAVPASVFALVQSAFCLFWEADSWLHPSRQVSTIQNLRTSLVRDWNPVCSLGGECSL